jgi:AcrR family transcriptional regulator
MARKKSLDQGPVLRGEILARAAELFYERGYAATSIRDIAEAVGISSSTMYHHFTNKQEVLRSIVVGFMVDFNAATLPVLADGTRSAVDRLAEVIRIHIEMSDDRRPELLAGNPIRYALSGDEQEEGIALQARYHDAVLALVDQGCATGEFRVRDPGMATMALLDMLNGVREWYSPGGRLGRDQVVKNYLHLALDMLRARQGAATRRRQPSAAKAASR